MPTKTFLNLQPEKQKLLLNAATKEFSRHTLMDASINQIIQEASIPRGSFYQYFEDKEDLYFYILEQNNEQIIEGVTKALNKEEDALQGFIKIYDFLYSYIIKSGRENYYKNLMLTIQKLETKEPIRKHPFDRVILEKFKKKTFLSEETFTDLFDILSVTLVKMLIDSLKNKDKQQEIRKRFINILQIIHNGIQTTKEEIK